jgi:hypothetical protein
VNWLFEQPLIIVALGVTLILGLGAAWSASGRKELLYAVGAAMALLVVGLVSERLVVTDREAIRQTLLEIATHVKNNDHAALRRRIHSSATDLKRKADAELPGYHFTECRITRIHKIDIDTSAAPHSALVEFNIMASGTFKVEGTEVSDTVPRWVQLQLLREDDGRWTVSGYDHAPPQQMMFERPR